jgi:hypothetical protein
LNISDALPESFVLQARTTIAGNLRVTKGGPHRKHGPIEKVLAHYAALGYCVSAQRQQVRTGGRLGIVSFTLVRRHDVDLVERLERLAKLHADGHLTDAEFEAAKQIALDGRDRH